MRWIQSGWPALALALLLVATAVPAAAAPGPGGFLNVNQAFRYQVRAANRQTLRVHFRIHKGYYLYRKQFRFSLVNPPADLQIAATSLSRGEKKHDPYFGEVDIYHRTALATLHLNKPAPAGAPLSLKLHYQGCAEKGICYPPQTRTVSIHTAAPAGSSGGTGTAPGGGESSRLTAMLGHASLALTAMTFLGLGVLLAFTPCVLPMIPILSGIIVGQGSRSSALRGFLLSLSYVLAMAAAYTVFGVIAGLAGQNLQAALQTPAALSIFTAVFVLLALSMFGLYELQLPQGLRQRLNRLNSRQSGGSFTGAALLGFTAALIVGPCVSPALAGALLYIGQTGNAWLGGLALFALGLGMGLPLLLLGALGGHWLPRAGQWMERISQVFGVVFLGVAIWMLARIIPPAATLALWAALFLVSAIYLGALEPLTRNAGGWRRLWKGIGIAALVYGVLLAVGAASGGQDPLQPLHGLFPQPRQQSATTASASPNFRSVHDLAELKRDLASAATRHKPVVLDFDAAWCLSCKHIRRYVLTQPRVRRELSRAVLLRADVTADSQAEDTLMKHYHVVGPPTFLFFNRDGNEVPGLRLVGDTTAQAFSKRMQQLLSHE